jgi:hypothetical protein
MPVLLLDLDVPMTSHPSPSIPVADPAASAARPDQVLCLGPADLAVAARRGILTPGQGEALWRYGVQRGLVRAATAGAEAEAATLPPSARSPRFGLTQVLYYFGGMLAIGAMTLFMSLTWDAAGAWGITVLAALYLVGALAVARHFKRGGLAVPAGILATLAVCLVPLIVWGVQMGLGLWPPGAMGKRFGEYHHFIDGRWLTLELATLAAGVVMLWLYRLPFMVMPLAVTLWYMSMDVGNLLMGGQGFDWTLSRNITLVFGLATLAMAMWVDVRTRRAREPDWRQDYAFWLYLFGAIMAWCGLSLMNSDSEWGKLGYALINAALVLLGAAIGRRVFTVLGALGVAGYLGYLSWHVFKGALLFPIALTLIGLGVMALGVWWQRHEAALQARLARWVPEGLRPR